MQCVAYFSCSIYMYFECITFSYMAHNHMLVYLQGMDRVLGQNIGSSKFEIHEGLLKK